LQQQHLIVSPLLKGIKNLCFSSDGKLLAASSMDDEHNIAVYDLSVKSTTGAIAPIATGRGSRAILFSLCFSNPANTLVSTGVREVNFHTITNGTITTKKGTGIAQTPTTILSSTFVGATLFTGTLAGEIQAWSGNAMTKAVKTHTSKVNTLFAKDAQTLFSGGGDGLVIQWQVTGTGLIQKQQWDIKGDAIGSAMPQVISVHTNPAGKILVGTRGSEIIEFNGQEPRMFVKGHYDLELWGLAIHPNQTKCYTYGQDSMLAIWDL